MIQPAKQLTFKRRRKRKNMLPFLFQNVEKAKNGIATARFQYSLAVSAGVVPLRLTRGRSSHAVGMAE